jgi:PTH2 family peptidyl-tRNA hydrolase
MKQVIVMRKDLGMRTGKMIAQGCHASMKSVLEYPDHPGMKKWLADKFTKIVVRVESEQELFDIYNKAKIEGLIVSLIQDAGLTEFGGIPTYTCIAIGPATDEELNPITGHLKLL